MGVKGSRSPEPPRRRTLLAGMLGGMAQPQEKDAGPRALAEYRQRIDAIDRRMVGLLEERAKAVRQIGRVKRQRGMPIEAPEREQQVLRNVMAAARSLPPESVKRVWERILTEMKSIE